VITLSFSHAEDPLTDNRHDLRDEDPKIPLDSDTALGNKKLMTSRDVFRQSLPVVAQLWMTAVLIVFILIRVVGSHTVQNLLHQLRSF
jgi:hypothetical protein